MAFSDGSTTWPLAANADGPTSWVTGDHPGDGGKELFLALTWFKNRIKAVEDRIGLVGSSVVGTVEQRLGALTGSTSATVVDVTQWGVFPTGHASFVSAAQNASNFNALEAAITNACVFWFPTGEYQTTGFQLTKRGHKILGAGGASAIFGGTTSGTIFKMTGTGCCLDLRGSNTTGGRLYGLQVEGVLLKNASTGTNIGLRLRHLTHFILKDVSVTSFRGLGGGMQFYNSMDGSVYDCCVDFCGSADATNLAAVYFTYKALVEGGNAEDACNEIKFFRFRMENCSDQYMRFESGSGLQTNRIQFIGCKFENSQTGGNSTNGTNDTNQATFLYQNASHISFTTCDFTFQNRQSAFNLPRMHYLTGGSSVAFTDVDFAFGAGSFPKVYTYFVEATGSGNNYLQMANVVINSGNSTAFPTLVLKGSNTPKLSMKSVMFSPFQGSGKVATDFYTAAEWSTAGVIA